MKTPILAVAALGAALALLSARAARADEPALASVDDAQKKLANGSPLLVLFAKAESDDEKAFRAALADKKLAKPAKDATAVRVDPGDDDSAKKLGLAAAEKGTCVFVLDGYGIAAAKHEKAPTADALAHLLKQADEATRKKKKIEKGLDGAVAKGEAALKRDDTRTACEQFLAVVEYEKTVPCAAVTTAKKHLDELEQKGLAVLQEARTATGKSDFAKAQKLIVDATTRYPLPAVEADAKKAKDELAQEEAAQQK